MFVRFREKKNDTNESYFQMITKNFLIYRLLKESHLELINSEHTTKDKTLEIFMLKTGEKRINKENKVI